MSAKNDALECAQRDLDSYKRTRIDFYVPLCALDKKCCPCCGEMDGKPLPVRHAIIGVNFPPFYDGCRCTTISFFADIPTSPRSARDPLTNKSYLTECSTYSEWHDSLTPEQKECVATYQTAKR